MRYVVRLSIYMTKERARELYREYVELDLRIGELIEAARNIPKDLARIKLLQFDLLTQKTELIKTLQGDCYRYLELEGWQWEEIR